MAELRRSIESNLRFLVTAIGHPEAPLDMAAPEATGRRRAHQGAPLPEVLRCYRICDPVEMWFGLEPPAAGLESVALVKLKDAATLLGLGLTMAVSVTASTVATTVIAAGALGLRRPRRQLFDRAEVHTSLITGRS
jgi:hypothetical protein